jgi:two-component system NtrC family response regulator
MDTRDPKTRSRGLKARILVVDDQPEVALVVRAMLVHEGFEVETAVNGREALDLLMSALHFDLIITDVRMPEMDGLELLRRARQMRKDLPVIVMTGHATRRNRLDAMEKGAFDYVSKPFGIRVLLKAVHDALRGK